MSYNYSIGLIRIKLSTSSIVFDKIFANHSNDNALDKYKKSKTLTKMLYSFAKTFDTYCNSFTAASYCVSFSSIFSLKESVSTRAVSDDTFPSAVKSFSI